MRRILILAFAFWIIGTGLAVSARADVRVTITPDDPTAHAQSGDGYTVTTDGPVDTIRVLLPSHGKPCGVPDQYGQPQVGGDATTNFLVTDATAPYLVSGRWVAFSGPFAHATSIHLSVLTPPLGGCFYAGVTANPSQGVIGIARGASIYNGASMHGIATSGVTSSNDPSSRDLAVTWTIENNSNHDVTFSLERVGASSGFSYASSSFAGNPWVARQGVSWSWHQPIVIPAGGTDTETVNLRRPCGIGSVNLRLRVASVDGLVAGTGNGVPAKLAAC